MKEADEFDIEVERWEDEGGGSYLTASSSKVRWPGHLLLGLGVGALMGVTAALLSAPKSGAESREDLTAATGQAKDRVERMVGELKQSLDDLTVKSRELLEEAKDRVETAVRTGKETASATREEMREQLLREDA